MRLTFLLPLALAGATPALAQNNPTVPGYTGGETNFGQSYDLNQTPGSGYTGPAATNGKALEHARLLLSQGDYAQANGQLTYLLGRMGTNEVRFLKGVALLGMGDARAARGYFDAVSKSRSYRHPGALSGLALAQIRLGNVDAAQDILRRLQVQQTKCNTGCARAPSLDQAVTVVEKALS